MQPRGRHGTARAAIVSVQPSSEGKWWQPTSWDLSRVGAARHAAYSPSAPGLVRVNDGAPPLEQPLFRSWDVFDTLIARRFGTPRSVVDQLAAEFGFDPDRRIREDTGLRSLAEIYQAAGLGDHIMLRELELERLNAVPIAENMSQVRHGDVLVSDMYLSGPQVLWLVRSAGLEAQVSVYVSNGDKRTGAYWSRLTTSPALHTGDNLQSDVTLPSMRGIAAQHYTGAALTEDEAYVTNHSTSLAYLMREIRLRTAATGLTAAVTSWNIPFLLAACRMLEVERPVFLGRDCQSLCRLWDAFVGPASYLPFSRLAAVDVGLARAYVESHTSPGDTLVDLISTGATWERLGLDRDIVALIHLDDYTYTGREPAPARFIGLTKASEWGGTDSIILEAFNRADHGHLAGIRPGEPVRLLFEDLEYDARLLDILHGPIRQAVALAPFYPGLVEGIRNPGELLAWAHGRMCESRAQFGDELLSSTAEYEIDYLNQVQRAFGVSCDPADLDSDDASPDSGCLSNS